MRTSFMNGPFAQFISDHEDPGDEDEALPAVLRVQERQEGQTGGAGRIGRRLHPRPQGTRLPRAGSQPAL